jgi:serine/threonine protein kinase
MSTTVTQRVELPEGYTVVDRLGAGGYGEVWKATAPGGLEKAVKIVFGHCDEGMAERELKSLERIKSVRHPFLLSIERYEIVNNRLVIVTELADMSLSDCFQNHIAAGSSGIPRDQLIAYLWDAAEALDCLIEHHSLQHLDVKPENLLLIGEHIKVADFGLVKELASKTLNSVMGGMTPLYSAPEIYDNNPSPRSDQYSLAIVYQHMLTATLPFSGRTPAQLAKQHTLAQPNVNPLSEADRAIVRKALEKSPSARFASCREFVSALRSVGHASPASFAGSPATVNTSQSPPIAGDDTKSISLADTQHLRDPICVAATQKLSEIEQAVEEIAQYDSGRRQTPQVLAEFPVVDGQIVDVDVPEFDPSLSAAAAPTLFVGVGGIGIKLLKAIRTHVNAHDPQQQKLALAWLAIDTERETLKTHYDEDELTSLSANDKLHIPLRRPNQYRDDSQALLQWVSRRWLYNIPRSLQTRGFRPLGRIAIVDHAAAVLTALQKRLQALTAPTQEIEGNRPEIRVVVLAGMSGGTGGGTIIDIAQAVRSLCRDFSHEVTVQAVLGCTYHHDSNDSLAAANMYALLTELMHAQRNGNCGENSPPGPASLYESSTRPFDEIYTLPMTGRSECDLTLQSAADYLLLDAGGAIHPPIQAIRKASSIDSDQGYLRTFSCINLGQLIGQFSLQCQQDMLKALVAYWLKPGSPVNDPDALLFQSHSHSQFARAVLARFPEIVSIEDDPEREAETAEQKSRRSAKIKCMAKAFLQALDFLGVHSSADQELLNRTTVAATGERIIAALCLLLEREKPSEKELATVMLETVNSQLLELTAGSAGPNRAELAQTVLAHFSTGPLDCGYQRHTLLVAVQNQSDPALIQACRDRCPTLANYTSGSHETFLVREGANLSPLHLGARLAELYPDIADAGGRLHSRDDIKWQDLRVSSVPTRG